MKFIRLIPKSLLSFDTYVNCYKDEYFVFYDSDEICKLAIKVSVDIYALYDFSEFSFLDDEQKKKIIDEYYENSSSLFRESIGVFNTNTNGILYDIRKIVKFNSTDKKCFFSNLTDSIVELGYDELNNIYGIFIFNKLIFKLTNKPSADDICNLIKKDIKNFLKYRFGIMF